MNTPEIHLDPELLSAYLDEEVSADERQLIEAHLPTCEGCRKELESLRFTAALMRALPPRPIPRTFYVTEEMVAPAPKSEPSGWARWLRAFAPFGALVATMLVVLVLARPMLSGGNPAAMPQTVQAPEIAVMSTQPAEAQADAAMEAAPTTAEARQSDLPEEPSGGGEAPEAVIPPAAEPTSAPADESANAADNYTLTAPIVGADDAAGVTESEVMTTVVAITPDADVTRTATVATQEGTNTLIIFALIVMVASIAAVLLLARRRG